MGIKFEIENPELISVNEQYIHPVKKSKSGKYTSYFVKSSKLKKLQAFYDEQLKVKISDDEVNELKTYLSQHPYNGIELKICIGMPVTEINSHDTTNYIKALEDCIVKRTGIDDVKDYKVVAEKQISNDKWMVRIELAEHSAEIYEKIN